jgi:UDPglucose 6-dehydrogenase
MDIGIVGMGRVGIPTAVGLAKLGHCIVTTDRDGNQLDAVANAKPPFYEPGLAEALAEQLMSGRIRCTPSLAEIAEGAQVIFLCVSTPLGTDGRADLSAIEEVLAELATNAQGPLVIVVKCTVPAGTAELLQLALQRRRPDLELTIVSNPEFLREGSALEDVLRPHRILVGAASPVGTAAMRAVYAQLIDGGCPLIETDLRTAELAKHASNAFLALKTSYANAIAGLCERIDADVVTVAEAMGLDPRIARGGLDAGLGFGGSCLPADLEILDDLARRSGYAFPLLAEIRRLNEEAMERVIDTLVRRLGELAGRRIALFGLAFKADTDDTRGSPALKLASRLDELGCEVRGCDPVVSELGSKSSVVTVEDPYRAAENAEAAVICTPWAEFRSLDLERLRDVMARPLLIDARNLLDPRAAAAAGIEYVPTGRPSPNDAGSAP